MVNPGDLILLEGYLTPILLCWYAAHGEYHQIKGLIELGVDINRLDYDKRSALHLAAAEGNRSVLRLLLENGA